MSSAPEGSRIAMRVRYYNEHCWLQHACMLPGLELIPNYADRNNLTIVDYGCSQGANSIEPVQKAVSTVPDGATVSLFFEDTPSNDFETLAKTIYRHFSSPEADKRLFISPAMVPVGFFQQVVPDNHADLGFSFASFNYLETTPEADLSNVTAPSEFLAAKMKAFAPAAKRDLIKILKLRGREIRSGGHLIFALHGTKPTDPDRDGTAGHEPMTSAMMKMVTQGKLKMDEMKRFAHFPSHERSQADLREAFEAPEVAPLWEVESLETKLIEHPAWADYEAKVAADSSKKDEAMREYGYKMLVNLISSAGWMWVDMLKKTRGEQWDGGEAFLEELTRTSVDEYMEKFQGLRSEVWVNYVKLRRTEKKPAGGV